MTDVLLKPEDTGDIPRAETGETTRRMHPMIATGPFPTLRSADALTVAQPRLPQSIGIVDPPRVREPAAVIGLIEEAATSPIGMPVPPTTPDPKVGGPEDYVGRHRAPDDLPAEVPPGRFGWLRSVLTAAMATVRRAL